MKRDGYYRYADNVLLITNTATEGRAELERTRELLAEVRLTLKGAPGTPRDLSRGDHLDLLGLRLTRTGDTLTLEIPNTKWDDLQTKLVETHGEANPTATARQLVIGWTQAHTPAFGINDRMDEETVNRLINLLRDTGHRHALTRDQIVRTMRTASAKWERTVSEARTRLTAELNSTPSTTTGTTAHTTAVIPTVDHMGMDGITDGTTQDATAQYQMGGTTGTESEGSSGSIPAPASSPMTSSRPSGRSTALPGRPVAPQSAYHCRARTSHAAVTCCRTHRPRHPSGGRSMRARPPPRPP